MSSKNYDLYKNPNQNPLCDEFFWSFVCFFMNYILKKNKRKWFGDNSFG